MAYIANVQKEMADIVKPFDYIQMQTVLIVSSILRKLKSEYPTCLPITGEAEESAAHIAYMWPGRVSPKQVDLFQKNYDKLVDDKFALLKSYGLTSLCLVLVEDMMRKRHPVTRERINTRNQEQALKALLIELQVIHFWFDRGNVSQNQFTIAVDCGKHWLSFADHIQAIQLYTDKYPEDFWRACVVEMRELLMLH